jgi:hypothetical protein
MARAGSPAPRVTGLRPAPWWLRVFLLVNVLQDFAIGISGEIGPEHSLLPLKGLTPLNTRFICALYLGGGVVILLAAFVRYAVDARIALYSFLVITVLVLAMTVAYWEDFTVDGVPWLWMVTYVLDPLVTVLVLVTLRLGSPAQPGRHWLTTLFVTQAVVFGGFGVLLLAAPGTAVEIWPWALTPLLARVYSAFFLAFAAGALLAANERRTPAVRPLLIGSLALLVGTLAASIAHADRFTGGVRTWLWFGVHLVGVALFAIALTVSSRGVRTRGPVAAGEL